MKRTIFSLLTVLSLSFLESNSLASSPQYGSLSQLKKITLSFSSLTSSTKSIPPLRRHHEMMVLLNQAHELLVDAENIQEIKLWNLYQPAYLKIKTMRNLTQRYLELSNSGKAKKASAVLGEMAGHLNSVTKAMAVFE